jgi:hypothetical protein
MGLWSGSVRIDIAVINGELAGFELKSDRDTLNRLPFQAEIYSRVFDRVDLVVGHRHFREAEKIIPNWWGIRRAATTPAGLELEQVRESCPNPAQDSFLLAQLLWKAEALAVLERHDLAKGCRGKRVKDIHLQLADSLTRDVLGQEVRGALKRRDGWLRQARPNTLDVPVYA